MKPVLTFALTRALTLSLFLFSALTSLSAQAALDPVVVKQLAAEERTTRLLPFKKRNATATPEAEKLLKALADDALFFSGEKATLSILP